LMYERAIAMGNAIDSTSRYTYGSALNSYLTFVRIHNIPVDPTEETLSFFTVYTSNFIQPRSVASYLSGVCNQLEPWFPNVHAARRSMIVTRTLEGCLRLKSVPVSRKRPLSLDDLQIVLSHFHQNPSHDDLLFISMLLTGFFALMRLGELTFADNPRLRNWRKVSRRSTVTFNDIQYSFHLPSHKADRATSLAEHAVSPTLIQAMGRWSSEAFKIYVRKHPVLLHALLFGADH
ncbi:hypothetical protein HYPSUDRAFT_1076184, partial [Hypholoma sublateritium FD-334 SS-4]